MTSPPTTAAHHRPSRPEAAPDAVSPPPRPAATSSSAAPRVHEVVAPESAGQELRRLGADAAGVMRALRRQLGRRWTAVVAVAAGAGGDWWRPASATALAGVSRLRRALVPLPAAEGVVWRALPWRRALGVGLAAFALWTVLDAPTLLHDADGAPLGARRSVAMSLLRPVAAVSEGLGLSHLVGAADRLMGRDGPGVVQVGGPPPAVRRSHRAPAAAHPAPPATDALAPLPAPTTSAPLRVLVVGDSLGVDIGGPLADTLAATGVVGVAVDAHVDTGLARPDYFDWPGELQADLGRYHPQAVVVFLGANDPQNMVQGGSALAFGSPAWDAAYATRVGQFMAEATGAGARVLWVGMPPMQDQALDSEMQQLDALYQAQAAAHPGVTFLSSWTVLGTPQGAYAEYLPDATGSPVAVREPDGTHISPGGATRLSQAVVAAMDRGWGLTLAP
jgi:lysophospholipase L1-like esterase